MNPQVPGPELRDIHMPPEPSWWPPAPGWWLLACLTIAALWFAWRWAAPRWRRRQARRRVLAELEGLSAAFSANRDAHALLVALSRYTRRLVRAFAPQAVALTGKDWSAFLARASGDSGFVDGAALALSTAPYQARSAADPEALLQSVRRLAERLQQAPGSRDV